MSNDKDSTSVEPQVEPHDKQKSLDKPNHFSEHKDFSKMAADSVSHPPTRTEGEE